MLSAKAILSRLEMFGVRLGLDQSRRLLAALGAPHEGLPVVLVAGSNGKGSTAALLASIVGAAGYRVGLYTSPHLEEVEERIRINGCSIGPGELGSLLQRVVDAGMEKAGSPPTYFESLTVAAFVYFRRQAVDLAVMEVGLGGRLDATNVAEPMLSLITSIALDHQGVLGESLGEIAREKAGILRTGVPAASWVEAAEARAALTETAAELGVSLQDARQVSRWSEPEEDDSVEGCLVLETVSNRYRLEVKLAGEHQRRNVALAVVAAENLSRLGWRRIGSKSIERGIAACRWPGRLETVHVGDDQRVLLDCAHNQEAVALLRRHLESLSTVRGDDQVNDTRAHGVRFCLLFGALRDKAAKSMLETIARGASEVLLTAPRSPRALQPETVASVLAAKKVTLVPDSARALSLALESATRLTVVCGSLYLVGEVRQELRRRFALPQAAVEVRTGL